MKVQLSNLVTGFFSLLSRLPLRCLYALSDVEYLFVYHVIRYRRGIVARNLATSLPEKSPKERRQIEREFYHWFCDYFFEAIKLLTINREELTRRLTIVNSEEVEKCFEEGQDAAAILGHYGNWEWLSCVGIALPANRAIGLIYHPLRSRAFDELFIRLRSHVGGTPVPKKDILRQLVRYRQDGVRSIFGYIADQGPKWENIHLWLPFLNHDTGVFTGAERIMRRMNDAVFYVEMSRPRRGYYTCTYRLLTRDPASEPPYAITRRFFQLLEETIRRQPQFYLWTHNRWKRTHEEFDRRFEVVDGKVVARKEVKSEELGDRS